MSSSTCDVEAPARAAQLKGQVVCVNNLLPERLFDYDHDVDVSASVDSVPGRDAKSTFDEAFHDQVTNAVGERGVALSCERGVLPELIKTTSERHMKAQLRIIWRTKRTTC